MRHSWVRESVLYTSTCGDEVCLWRCRECCLPTRSSNGRPHPLLRDSSGMTCGERVALGILSS